MLVSPVSMVIGAERNEVINLNVLSPISPHYRDNHTSLVGLYVCIAYSCEVMDSHPDYRGDLIWQLDKLHGQAHMHDYVCYTLV